MATPEQITRFCEKYISQNQRNIRLINQTIIADLEGIINPEFQRDPEQTDTYERRDDVCVSVLFVEDLFARYDFKTGRYIPNHNFSLLELPHEQIDEFYAKRKELFNIAEQDAQLRQGLRDIKKDQIQYKQQIKNDALVGLFGGFVIAGFIGEYFLDYSTLSEKLLGMGIVAIGAICGTIVGYNHGKRVSNSLYVQTAQKKANTEALRQQLKEKYEQKYAEFKRQYHSFVVFDKQAIEAAAR